MDDNPLRDQFRMHRVPGSCAVVIFGGLGDLAGRKLVPALYNLYLRRLLPAGFSITTRRKHGPVSVASPASPSPSTMTGNWLGGTDR